MALISFFSAKGAPGVTSTAMLVAALWPRPTLLVDADAAGGDVLMRLPSEAGSPLTQRPGLLTLLPLARHGLAPGVVLDHTQVLHGGQRVLVGVETTEQAEASGSLWPTLARAFRELPGADVIIDLGSLSTRSAQLALGQRSDLLIGVLRPAPASVLHTRQRLAALDQAFATLEPERPRLGLVCLEDVQRQTEASSAVATARGDLEDVLDLGQVAVDRRAERMFHGDPVSRPERTMLVRSGRALVDRLVLAVGAAQPPAQPQPQAQPRPGAPTTPATPGDAPAPTPVPAGSAADGASPDPDAIPEKTGTKKKWRFSR